MVDWAENGLGDEVGQLVPRYDVKILHRIPQRVLAQLKQWAWKEGCSFITGGLKGILKFIEFWKQTKYGKKIYLRLFLLETLFQNKISLCGAWGCRKWNRAGKCSFIFYKWHTNSHVLPFTSVTALKCSSASLLHLDFWAITCCAHPLAMTWFSGVKLLQGVRDTWPCPRTPDRICSWAEVHPHLIISSSFPFLEFRALPGFIWDEVL